MTGKCVSEITQSVRGGPLPHGRGSDCMLLAGVVLLIVGEVVRAQTSENFNLSWHTIDGGGATSVSSAGFQLSGTIGQSDPGFMASTSYDLEGGFWVISAGESLCDCPGDLNSDSLLDGDDVQMFVQCLLVGGPGCVCADMDGVGGVNVNDVTLFVTALLEAAGCP